MLSVLDVHKSYGDVPVLADVTFTVAPGEAVAIVGGNGAGKSTLLKCLVGAETYDQGSVSFLGDPLDETSSAVRAKMASLLDDVDFFPDISVIEHLRMLAWLHGADDPEQRVSDLVDDLGLQRVRDQLPPTLSSGQRHRLGLAACFVRPRELLILDEPEQRLDVQGRHWLRTRLNEEKVLGVSVVFASHDNELVEAVADRTIRLAS